MTAEQRSEEQVGTAPGLFLCFEGGDGSGKSTQTGLLHDELVRRGLDVLVTRQPGGTPLGARIRQLLLQGERVSARAEALLFAADKAHHVDEVILPALARGAVVITDRYTDSAIAYQGAGRGLGADDLRGLQHWAVDGLYPDLTVLLDVHPRVGRERRGQPPDRMESEAEPFHAAVREAFVALAAAAPRRYLVLDACLPSDEIHDRVLARVEQILERRR